MTPRNLILLIVLTVPAAAIDIADAVFDSANSPTRPTADPDGAKLVAHANEAAARWETAIHDVHGISFTVRYDTSAPAKGRLDLLGVSGGKATNVRIRINPNQNWYFDGTPSSDGEFFPEPAFAFEEDPNDSLYPFDGTPPGRLEISYSGLTIGANATKPDLLTVLIHHLGRALGFSDTFSSARAEIDGDGDVDIPSGWVAGQTMAVEDDPDADPDDYSLAVVNSALNHLAVAIPGRRCIPSTLDYLTVAQCGGWGNVRPPRMEFLRTGTQGFINGSNWPGGQNPLDTADVFIQQAAPTTVLLNGAAVKNLRVGGSSVLEVYDHLSVTGEMTIRHNGNLFQIPRVRVRNTGLVTTPATNVVGGILEIEGTLTSTSFFTSPAATTGRRGECRMIVGVILSNDFSNSGLLKISGGYSLIAKINIGSFLNVNLDGNSAESASEVIIEADSELELEEAGFTDGFDGRLEMDGRLTIDSPFTLGTSGRMEMGTGTLRSRGGNAARLTVNGTIDFTDGMDISVPVTFGAASTLISGTPGGILQLRDDTTFVQGMEYLGSGLINTSDPQLDGDNVVTLAGSTLDGLRLSVGEGSRLEIGDALTPPGHAVSLRYLHTAVEMTMEIGGTEPDTFDTVTTTESVSLGGILDVRFDGFTPQPGQTWRLVSGQRNGSFSAVSITGANPADFEVLYDATGVTLRMLGGQPTLAEWLASKGVPANLRGKHDDPDGDGVPNCLEALFALDPMAADKPSITAGTTTLGGPNTYGTVTLLVNEETFADIGLVVEASADLQQWNIPLTPMTPDPPEDGKVLIRYRCNSPIGTLPECFFRARCTDVIAPPVTPL